jgi:hypothetical protein
MFKVGDLVEIRSKAEILQTLDRGGRLEALPFMPTMFAYCGQRFKIYRNAYKTCDTVSGRYIGLRADGCVHLNMRCDGAAYEGCQAGCLIFWKTAWLKPVGENADPLVVAEADAAFKRAVANAAGCTEDDVYNATRTRVGGKTLYVCQATALLEYTKPLKWWNPKQYLDAYRTGNRSAIEIVKGLTFLFYAYGTRANKAGVGAPARWLYNRARPIWGGIEFPRRPDLLKDQKSSPRLDLRLKPGDIVRVKPYHEILATLDKKGANRGLMFDAELVPYCGKTFRVKRFVEKFVNEANGEYTELKTPAVILDGAVCMSRFSGQRMFCPREIYGWWREVWLERTDDPVMDAERTPKKAAYDRPAVMESVGK